MKIQNIGSAGSQEGSVGLDQKSVVEITKRASTRQRSNLEKELKKIDSCHNCHSECKNLVQLKKIQHLYTNLKLKNKQLHVEVNKYINKLITDNNDTGD